MPEPSPTNSCSATRNPPRSSFPESSNRVPSVRRSASHAWLNQTAVAGPASIGDGGLDDPQPAPRRGTQPRRPHLHLHRRRLAGPQLGERSDLAAVAIAVRDVEQEIAERREAELRRRRRQPRPRPPQNPDRSLEPAGLGQRPEGRPTEILSRERLARSERARGRSGAGLGWAGGAHPVKARTQLPALRRRPGSR